MREEGLVQITQNLLDFLVAHAQPTSIDLQALAYTLQIGRAALEERLAFTVTSVRDLIEKLQGFIEGRQSEFDMWRGRVKRNDETRGAFADDEMFKEMIDTWMQQRQWSKILDIWVQGFTVDWHRLYEPQPPRRMSLPTYPFARQKCWVKESTAVDALPPSGKPWLAFAENWVRAPLETATYAWTEKIEIAKDHRILVISQDVQDVKGLQDVCRTIATLSERQGDIWDVQHMPIDVATKSSIEAADVQPYLTDSDAPQVIFFFLPQSLATGLTQLELVYSCVQAVMQVAPSRPIQWYCCYQEPPSDARLYGEGLAGLFKSAMLESLHHRYRAVSYDAQLVSDGQVALRLIQEWLCDATLEVPPERVPMVRYAQGHRFELRVAGVDPDASQDERVGFRSGATYLMVGALGDAGQLICEELGRRYQAQLVIFSRRGEHEVQAPLARIQAAGASVIYRAVDLLDRAALQQAMQSVKDAGIELHGVVHMARRVLDGPIINKPFSEFREVIAAKVQGTLNLDAVTAEEPLDFFLMFSSMAAFGIQGSPDYAFSAAFQNAVARHRNRLADQGQRSGYTRSICWGQWDVDGAVHPDQLPARLERLRHMGIDCIDVPLAMTLMERSTSQPCDVVGYMAVHDMAKARHVLGVEASAPTLAERVLSATKAFEGKQWSELEFAAFLDTVPDDDLSEPLQHEIIRVLAASDGQRHAPPHERNGSGVHAAEGDIGVVKTPGAETAPQPPPGAATKEVLTASVLKVMKISGSDLDWEQSLQTYGLDSIVAMQLAATLEQSLKFTVSPKWLDRVSNPERARGQIGG